LQFTLNEGLRIMLIPTGGFGWVIGDNQVAVPGQSECIIGVDLETRAQADNFVERAREAGARIVTAPQPQPWGYTGSFADPDGHLWMVTVPPS
jgi:predicted lactoylglutathione lyase